MAKEKNEIIKEADTEIKKYTSSEEAIHLEIMQEMWESNRASELGDARREGEKQNKIKTAKKLLEIKMDIEEISRITELSKEEIEKIKLS